MPEQMPDKKTGFSYRRHHDVFISYAQNDKPIADAICAKLEERRIRCWIAPRDVPPAMDFPAAIIEGIDGTQVMVLVFSSHANNSPHVIRELTNAVNKSRIIVPFRVEEVAPSKSMEYLIGVPHWLDAITPPLEEHIDELGDTIEHLLESKKEIICRVCKTHLSPQAKFCTVCGVPVTAEEIPPQQPAGEPAIPEPVPEPVPPPPPEPAEEPAPVQPEVPEEIPAPEPAHSAETIVAAPRQGYNKALAVSVIVVIIVIAGIFLVFSNPAGLLSNESQNMTMTSVAATPTIDYRSESAPINLVKLTAEPTQELPEHIKLAVEASKDPSTAEVVVQFNGGPGRFVVQDNFVTLTRSDGTVVTGKINFKTSPSELRMQGTRGTDRLQVVVIMGVDTRYTIIDELMPFRVRNIR